jgi:hypothetical protein
MPVRILATVVVLGALAFAPVRALALEMKPLATFHLSAADGATISSADVLGESRWIVVYAAPDCRPCDALLGLLRQLRTEGFAPRTILIVGAPHDEARAYVRQTLPSDLDQLRWYADDRAEAWDALDLAGAPTLVGVRDGRVEWGLSGAPRGPEPLRRLLRSWLTE